MTQVDFEKVSQRLAVKLSEAIYESLQYQSLAENLQAERDQARSELAALQTERGEDNNG